MWKAVSLYLIFFYTFTPTLVHARQHQLKLKNDVRPAVLLTQFGFFPESYFDLTIEKFQYATTDKSSLFGFTLDRSFHSGVAYYLENKDLGCILKPSESMIARLSSIFLHFDLQSQRLNITRLGNHLDGVVIHQSRTNETDNLTFPFIIIDNYISVPQITFEFPSSDEEGLYSLYFHNCAENKKVNLTVTMKEKNKNSFLSAGDQPLPILMFVLCVVYLIMGIFWLFYLKSSKHAVFKLHYLMLVVTLMKSLSLLFHGVNYHVIGKEGIHEEGWAVMYYITHLVKGALLFITIILVGAGWTFVKHVLTKKEKQLFVIVIPLQILANVATIIIEESEEGTSHYTTWKDIFILVDLLCCGAILFPIVWSIRHLQSAANVDGKVAINLRKMKLFRRFYVMIICYIYFTRIVVYLLRLTIPFAYTWTVELFREAGTIVFFIITGYTFRPVTDNPYFQLTQDEEDLEKLEMEDVWAQASSRESVNRVARDNQIDESADEMDVVYDAQLNGSTTSSRQPQQRQELLS